MRTAQATARLVRTRIAARRSALTSAIIRSAARRSAQRLLARASAARVSAQRLLVRVSAAIASAAWSSVSTTYLKDGGPLGMA